MNSRGSTPVDAEFPHPLSMKKLRTAVSPGSLPGFHRPRLA
ncbi:hypothetical protein B4098_0912 [Heyndrickxia coagulans]|uniref:Uncharacterized protein n=1 Tax=Heyndrickxia coagulans TaxID=1398 RepID=A0A150K7T1_HEYCO|nr:hypothetical protein B4098_0912 [Heyndrickxia coagulans]KYC69730.1 hypothetical protein B4099_1074 [Heyndrickxia coagulans]